MSGDSQPVVKLNIMAMLALTTQLTHDDLVEFKRKLYNKYIYIWCDNPYWIDINAKFMINNCKLFRGDNDDMLMWHIFKTSRYCCYNLSVSGALNNIKYDHRTYDSDDDRDVENARQHICRTLSQAEIIRRVKTLVNKCIIYHRFEIW